MEVSNSVNPYTESSAANVKDNSKSDQAAAQEKKRLEEAARKKEEEKNRKTFGDDELMRQDVDPSVNQQALNIAMSIFAAIG